MEKQTGPDAEPLEDPLLYTKRAKQFVDLHDQVEASVDLLDSLEGFLSTFQADLSAVSSQISTLQDRSKEIEGKLKSRRRIEKPLSSLLADLCVTPEMATVILDTEVNDEWTGVIPEFEARLRTINSRKRVKAARDLSEVTEGLRIVAATKIRAFFLALIQPIRTSMTTNMQVLQTSVLVKYKPLYDFLQSQASDVAKEIKTAYVASARVYFETGFRRYIRSLGWIKARAVEKMGTIGGVDSGSDFVVDERRLSYARIDGPPVVQSHIAESKTYVEPLEAVFRSMLLVLMDNATAEYAFVSTFFAPPTPSIPHSSSGKSASAFSPGHPDALRRPSLVSEAMTDTAGLRRDSMTRSISNDIANIGMDAKQLSKEEQTVLTNTWKQIMEPTLTYSQTFALSVLEPPPPTIPLLTMIRMMESVLAEVQTRGCGPLESWLFGLRMQFWPVFQKQMSDHVASLNKLTDPNAGGFFSRVTPPSDETVKMITRRYIAMFWSFVILTDTDDETMIFSNLVRLRQELTTIIVNQSKRITDPVKAATFQSTLFETLLQAMSKSQHSVTHPKAVAELTYWREREEESRSKISSTIPSRQPRQRT